MKNIIVITGLDEEQVDAVSDMFQGFDVKCFTLRHVLTWQSPMRYFKTLLAEVDQVVIAATLSMLCESDKQLISQIADATHACVVFLNITSLYVPVNPNASAPKS